MQHPFITALVLWMIIPLDSTPSPICEVTHLDWNTIFSDPHQRPFVSYTFVVPPNSLSLTIDIDLEYLGSSQMDEIHDYGTTYVLDFGEFDGTLNNIRQPGNCQNRLRSNFISPTFTELWAYSDTPFIEGHLAKTPYLAYPPAEHWQLTIEGNQQCSPIHYHGEFTWIQLVQCTDFTHDTQYTKITEDADWVNLTGIVYVHVVSPLTAYTESGFYRVLQLLSVPFTMSARKHLHVLSKFRINLFRITLVSVAAVVIEGMMAFRLTFLTESSDFLVLQEPTLFSAPSNGLRFFVETESLTNGCLSSGYLCLQLWIMTVEFVPGSLRRRLSHDNASCVFNFTGTYDIHFNLGCNPSATGENAEEICAEYMSNYAGAGVTISVDILWVDQICDFSEDDSGIYIFIIQFDDTEILFYEDESFTVEQEVYDTGDIVYVEVNVGLAEQFDVFDAVLNNVWICTTSPDKEPLLMSDHTSANSGCLSENVDPGFPKHLIAAGAVTEFANVTLYEDGVPNNMVRFAFPVYEDIERVNLYIHVQITLELIETTSR
eukprot:74721_1